MRGFRRFGMLVGQFLSCHSANFVFFLESSSGPPQLRFRGLLCKTLDYFKDKNPQPNRSIAYVEDLCYLLLKRTSTLKSLSTSTTAPHLVSSTAFCAARLYTSS